LTKVQNRPEVKMVSVLWVDKCKETQKIPLESDFPACAEVGPKKVLKSYFFTLIQKKNSQKIIF